MHDPSGNVMIVYVYSAFPYPTQPVVIIDKIINISGGCGFMIDSVNSVDGIFTWWPWVAVNMTRQSQRKGTTRECVTNNQAAQCNFGVLSCADILFIMWLTVNESHWKQNQNSCCNNRLSVFIRPVMDYSVVLPLGPYSTLLVPLGPASLASVQSKPQNSTWA